MQNSGLQAALEMHDLRFGAERFSSTYEDNTIGRPVTHGAATHFPAIYSAQMSPHTVKHRPCASPFSVL